MPGVICFRLNKLWKGSEAVSHSSEAPEQTVPELCDPPAFLPKGADSLSYGRFLFRFKAKDKLQLPQFTGGVFRGGFGVAMKRISCPPGLGRECLACLLNGECGYSYIFETPNQRSGELLDGVSHAPHPFVLRPPFSSRDSCLPDEPFEAQIILLGRALRLLPYVIYAFEEFGRLGIGTGRGKFKLENASAFIGETWKHIYTGDEGVLTELPWTRTFADELREEGHGPTDEIEIHFETPVRMKSGGVVARQTSFVGLMTALLRRIHLLDRWHGDGRLEFSHRSLIMLARQVKTSQENLWWTDWTRYSARQRAELKMGGFVGSVKFSGPLKSFLPYLKMGETLHVGKGTSFGMGMYSVRLLEG